MYLHVTTKVVFKYCRFHNNIWGLLGNDWKYDYLSVGTYEVIVQHFRLFLVEKFKHLPTNKVYKVDWARFRRARGDVIYMK